MELLLVGLLRRKKFFIVKVLCESGIVIGREEGKWTHYRISGAGRDQVLDHLKVLTDASEEISDCCSCTCGK